MALLTDGYRTLISFSVAPTAVVQFKEREVQAPDVDGGGEVDTTTMRNNLWRTKQPKHLLTLGDSTLQVQWNPSLYNTVASFININQLITITFPDGSTVAFRGWVDKFVPSSLKEGEFPMAELKIHCSNQDAFGNEVAPFYTSA